MVFELHFMLNEFALFPRFVNVAAISTELFQCFGSSS